MHPIIRWHGQVYSSFAVMTLLGFVIAAIYFFYAATRIEKFSAFKVVLFISLMYFVQVGGGWILPGIYKWFAVGPFPLSDLPKKGRYYHSVLLSALAFAAVYAKLARWPLGRLLDQLTISIGIMSPMGRIGCFLHGCCAGKVCDLPWAVKFKFDKEPVHPTQLYHLFFETFIVLPILFYCQKRKRFGGQILWVYLLVYSFFRFWVEFFRTNPIAWAGLSHAQLFSLVTAVIAGIVLVIKLKKTKNALGQSA